MKKARKLTAIILVLTMVLGLVACGTPAKKDTIANQTIGAVTGDKEEKEENMPIWASNSSKNM